MNLTRELLFAYVDGALSPEDARQVAAAVAKDADLHAYVEEQIRLKARLEAAFKPIPDAPMPDQPVRALAEPPATPRAVPPWRRSQSWIPAGAMAAGLALGILVADSFGMGGDISGQGGRLIAQGNLSRALSRQLAADADDPRGPPTRIGLSFVSREGNFCRSFETTRGEGSVSGLACRENGLWRIAALRSAAPRPGPQPSAAMPPAIREALDAMIVGDPLDAEAERAARNQNWRAR